MPLYAMSAKFSEIASRPCPSRVRLTRKKKKQQLTVRVSDAVCSFAFPDDGSKSTYSQMSGSPRHPSNDTSMQQNVDLKTKNIRKKYYLKKLIFEGFDQF